MDSALREANVCHFPALNHRHLPDVNKDCQEKGQGKGQDVIFGCVDQRKSNILLKVKIFLFADGSKSLEEPIKRKFLVRQEDIQ